jgi:hypothetical protein
MAFAAPRLRAATFASHKLEEMGLLLLLSSLLLLPLLLLLHAFARFTCCLGVIARGCVGACTCVCVRECVCESVCARVCMSLLLLHCCCMRACLPPCLNFICCNHRSNANYTILQPRPAWLPLVLHSSVSRSVRTAPACCRRTRSAACCCSFAGKPSSQGLVERGGP